MHEQILEGPQIGWHLDFRLGNRKKTVESISLQTSCVLLHSAFTGKAMVAHHGLVLGKVFGDCKLGLLKSHRRSYLVGESLVFEGMELAVLSHGGKRSANVSVIFFNNLNFKDPMRH